MRHYSHIFARGTVLDSPNAFFLIRLMVKIIEFPNFKLLIINSKIHPAEAQFYRVIIVYNIE